jgi:hypothetical protein
MRGFVVTRSLLSWSLLSWSLLSTPAPAWAAKHEVRFAVKHETSAFLREVAGVCVSSADSKVVAERGQVRLIEANDACAGEIRSFATRWDAEPSTKTVAVHARAYEEKMGILSRLSSQFPEDLKVDPGQACPCVLLRGSRAVEAARALSK